MLAKETCRRQMCVFPRGLVVNVNGSNRDAKEHRSRARGGARVRHLDHQPGADRAGLTVKIRCQNLVALSRSVFLGTSSRSGRPVAARRQMAAQLQDGRPHVRQIDGIVLGGGRSIAGERTSPSPRRVLSLLTEPPRCSPCALQATPESSERPCADAESI